MMSIYLELEAELREVHTDEGVLLARHQAVDGAGLVQVPAALLHQARVVRGLVQSGSRSVDFRAPNEG